MLGVVEMMEGEATVREHHLLVVAVAAVSMGKSSKLQIES